MDETRKDLVKMLVEAHSNELALINVLNSHIPLAQNGAYRKLLENHLKETEDHAERLRHRLDDLGYSQSALATAYAAAQNVVKQLMVLGKAPVDMIRGGSDVNEKMLRNAMDEAMTEGLEIASYDAIESLALAVGDSVTAEVAASIRVDEEAMFNSLRKMIPVLAADVAAERAPDAGAQQPWRGYDDMTVEEIQRRLSDATTAQLVAVREYELRNKDRKTILEATETTPSEL